MPSGTARQLWSPSSPSFCCYYCSPEISACPGLPTFLPCLLWGGDSPLLSSLQNSLAEGQLQAQAKLPPPLKLVRRQQGSSLFHSVSMQHTYLLHSCEHLRAQWVPNCLFINSLICVAQGDARGLLSLGRQGLWARDGPVADPALEVCSVQGPLSPEREGIGRLSGSCGNCSARGAVSWQAGVGLSQGRTWRAALDPRKQARLGHPRSMHSAWGRQARKCLLPHGQHSLPSSSSSALSLLLPPLPPSPLQSPYSKDDRLLTNLL